MGVFSILSEDLLHCFFVFYHKSVASHSWCNSSVTALWCLPPPNLKIDRAFWQGAGERVLLKAIFKHNGWRPAAVSLLKGRWESHEYIEDQGQGIWSKNSMFCLKGQWICNFTRRLHPPCLSNSFYYWLLPQISNTEETEQLTTQLREKIEKYEHVFSLESSANGNIWETNQNKLSTTPMTKSLSSSNHNILRFYIIPRVFHQKNPKHSTHITIDLFSAMNRKFCYASYGLLNWVYHLLVRMTTIVGIKYLNMQGVHVQNFTYIVRYVEDILTKNKEQYSSVSKNMFTKSEKTLKDAYRIKWQLAALKDEVKSVNVKVRIDRCLLG